MSIVLWQPYTFQDNTPYGLEEPDVLGTRRHRSVADLQPKPGWDPAGQDQRDAVANPARRPGTAGPDRSRASRPGIRGHAPTGGGIRRSSPSRGPSRRATKSLRLWSKAKRASPTSSSPSSNTIRSSSNICDTAVRHRRSMLSLNTVVGQADHAVIDRTGSGPVRSRSEESGSGAARDRTRGEDGTPNSPRTAAGPGTVRAPRPALRDHRCHDAASQATAPPAVQRATQRSSNSSIARLDAESRPVPQSRRHRSTTSPWPPPALRSPGQLKREQFTARYVGPYSVVPAGPAPRQTRSSSRRRHRQHDAPLRHPDAARHPDDPNLPIGGVSTIFDRNLNSNTVLGFDLAAPHSERRPGGRPNHFSTVTLDANISSGT